MTVADGGTAAPNAPAPSTSVRIPILMFHSVADDPPSATARLSVRTRVFAEQISYLKQRGFTGMTFGQLLQSNRDGTPLPSLPIVLTFDDGYADFAENALPVLADLGFPATVFVTTGWLSDGDGRRRPPDRMLSWRQLGELGAHGIEVGSHSHSHAQLDQIPRPQLRAELSRPKTLLEDRLGRAVDSMAYPYGYSRRHVRLAARAAGYKQAASVYDAAAALTADPFRVPRLTIRRSTSVDAFARIANLQVLGIQYAGAHMLTACCSAVRYVRFASGWRPYASGV